MDTELLIIHGFNDPSKGADNVDKVAGPLLVLGHPTDKDSTNYGWVGLLGVRLKKKKTVNKIIRALLQPGVIGAIAYSNGAYYLFAALSRITGKKFLIFLCSPALDKDAEIPASIEKAWVYKIRSDRAVKIAAWIPWSGWGGMGAYGYVGNDDRVTNVDYSDKAKGHGGMFKDGVIKALVQHVHDRITEES